MYRTVQFSTELYCTVCVKPVYNINICVAAIARKGHCRVMGGRTGHSRHNVIEWRKKEKGSPHPRIPPFRLAICTSTRAGAGQQPAPVLRDRRFYVAARASWQTTHGRFWRGSGYAGGVASRTDEPVKLMFRSFTTETSPRAPLPPRPILLNTYKPCPPLPRTGCAPIETPCGRSRGGVLAPCAVVLYCATTLYFCMVQVYSSGTRDVHWTM